MRAPLPCTTPPLGLPTVRLKILAATPSPRGGNLVSTYVPRVRQVRQENACNPPLSSVTIHPRLVCRRPNRHLQTGTVSETRRFGTKGWPCVVASRPPRGSRDSSLSLLGFSPGAWEVRTGKRYGESSPNFNYEGSCWSVCKGVRSPCPPIGGSTWRDRWSPMGMEPKPTCWGHMYDGGNPNPPAWGGGERGRPIGFRRLQLAIRMELGCCLGTIQKDHGPGYIFALQSRRRCTHARIRRLNARFVLIVFSWYPLGEGILPW